MTDTEGGRKLLAAAHNPESSWEDWAALDGWLDNNAPALLDALDAVERVRLLHHSTGRWCDECLGSPDGFDVVNVPYPCPTIRALDGEL